MTHHPQTDRIEQSVELRAPLERVWRAISDHREFGRWFGVAIDKPFEKEVESTGRMTVAGYEHAPWRATVAAIQPMKRFAFTWRPYAIDPKKDYEDEIPTLVEFLLAETPGGVRVTIRETGFDMVPAARRAEAFRMNAEGWAAQKENLRAYVEDAGPAR
jgi:uncharacterized protein YndB with AHSA1/START domain